MFLILSLVLASPFMAALYFYVDELAYDAKNRPTTVRTLPASLLEPAIW